MQASGEGVVVDGLQPVREDDALDCGAEECGAADARDRVGQNNRFQRRTHESAFGDFGDALRKMDDFSAVENGDIGGGDVVRFFFVLRSWMSACCSRWLYRIQCTKKVEPTIHGIFSVGLEPSLYARYG